MKHLTLIAFLSFLVQDLLAQKTYDISFTVAKDTISKSKSERVLHRLEITVKNIDPAGQKDYKLTVEVDRLKTTLPSSDYSIDVPTSLLTSFSKSSYIYVSIEKDSLSDRTRTLFLSLKVKKADGSNDDIANNTGNIKDIEIAIKGTEVSSPLNGFNYLGYVGTNFDLVDGIKAKNLFFAANVFLPPVTSKNKVGAYLSLYGNRTMTTSDSTSNVTRTSKLARISDTSYWRHSEQTDMKVSRVSDNLGAYINPLIKLWSASNPDNAIKLYYSPSLEFVWRRTETSYNFSNSRNFDSTRTHGSISGTIEYAKSSVQYANEYSFNVGLLGFFMVHESDQISMRVHVSVGYSTNYYPDRPNNLKTEETKIYQRSSDVFFSGRAWITEATTGITLQAEVTNTLINPRPFYGVTLSKAINFKNLGSIFQPITSR